MPRKTPFSVKLTPEIQKKLRKFHNECKKKALTENYTLGDTVERLVLMALNESSKPEGDLPVTKADLKNIQNDLELLRRRTWTSMIEILIQRELHKATWIQKAILDTKNKDESFRHDMRAKYQAWYQGQIKSFYENANDLVETAEELQYWDERKEKDLNWMEDLEPPHSEE